MEEEKYNSEEYNAIPISADIKKIMDGYFMKTEEQIPGKAAVEITKMLNQIYGELSNAYVLILSEDRVLRRSASMKLKKNLKNILCSDIPEILAGMKESAISKYEEE